MEIYKYCAESGLLVLKNHQIKVTPPNQFNDPFEFSPVVETKDWKADADKHIKGILTDPRFFLENRATFPHCHNFTEFQKFVQANRPIIEAQFKSDTPRLDAEFNTLEFLSEKFGVVCFSSDPVQPLMWAHYADSHKGMVLEFDSKDAFFDHEAFLKVDYNKDRVQYDPSAGTDKTHVALIAGRKSQDWFYENEYRLIVELTMTKCVKTDTGPLYLLSFDPTYLKSVTFGLRASKSLKNDALELANSSPLQHLKVFEISTDLIQFKLHRTQIK